MVQILSMDIVRLVLNFRLYVFKPLRGCVLCMFRLYEYSCECKDLRLPIVGTNSDSVRRLALGMGGGTSLGRTPGG